MLFFHQKRLVNFESTYYFKTFHYVISFAISKADEAASVLVGAENRDTVSKVKNDPLNLNQ